MNVPQLTLLARSLLAVGFLSGATAAMAQTQAPAPADDGGVQEVIVTAQKVAQPASKTPIALSVLSGDDLKEAGVNDPRGLTSTLPNVQIASEGGMLQIAIRGVTSMDMTEKGDPSSAFHVDGAYIPRYEAQGVAFYDLDRIEVLRGPQGTLYGRNATAGAINVITAKPTKKLEGRIGLEVGNFNTRRVEGMINVPINDMFALRAAVNGNKRDSYLKPGPNADHLENQDDRSGRVHLLADFNATTSLLLTAETSRIKGNGVSPVPLTNFFTGTPTGTLPLTPAGRGNNLLNPVYVDRGDDAQRTTAWEFRNGGRDAYRDHKVDSLRGEFKTTLGAVDVTYQLAHMDTELNNLDNGVYFGFPFTRDATGESQSTSHELRFNSTGTGALRWVAGAYYFNDEITRRANLTTYARIPPGPLNVLVPFDAEAENTSKAVFAQGTYELRKDTRLTLGARETRDRKFGADTLAGAAARPGTNTSPNAYSANVKFSDTSWRVGIDHDLRPNVMVYANVSTGYKAGGFNASSGSSIYKPEKLKSYEAGLKGRFLDNKLQLAATVFRYDYKDMQLSAATCLTNDPASCNTNTTNASDATINGLELEGKLRTSTNGMLRSNMAFTDAKFGDYRPTLTVDFSDQSLDRAPSATIGLGYTHHFPLASGAELTASLDTRHSTSYLISDPSVGIRYRQPSFYRSDITLGYSSPDGQWSAQLYARNLENEIKIESRVPGGFHIGDPRTFGLRATVNF